jgi:hypothetical protein
MRPDCATDWKIDQGTPVFYASLTKVSCGVSTSLDVKTERRMQCGGIRAESHRAEGEWRDA